MAEETTYSIIIKNETDKGGTPVATKTGAKTDAAKPVTESSGKKAVSDAGSALIAVQTIKPYVSQLVNAGISNIGISTGGIELQQRTQAFTSLAGTAAAVAYTGITMGPAAAAISLATIGVQTLMQAAIKGQQMQLQKQMENEQIDLRTSRMGMAVNRSRWQ